MKQQTFRDPFGGWAILQPDKKLKFYDKSERFVTTQDYSHEPIRKILEGIKDAGLVRAKYIH